MQQGPRRSGSRGPWGAWDAAQWTLRAAAVHRWAGPALGPWSGRGWAPPPWVRPRRMAPGSPKQSGLAFGSYRVSPEIPTRLWGTAGRSVLLGVVCGPAQAAAPGSCETQNLPPVSGQSVRLMSQPGFEGTQTLEEPGRGES